MPYTRDRDMYCGKERKRTRHTRCPNCRGTGNRTFSQCGWSCQDGYWCANGLHDRWHK